MKKEKTTSFVPYETIIVRPNKSGMGRISSMIIYGSPVDNEAYKKHVESIKVSFGSKQLAKSYRFNTSELLIAFEVIIFESPNSNSSPTILIFVKFSDWLTIVLFTFLVFLIFDFFIFFLRLVLIKIITFVSNGKPLFRLNVRGIFLGGGLE